MFARIWLCVKIVKNFKEEKRKKEKKRIAFVVLVFVALVVWYVCDALFVKVSNCLDSFDMFFDMF